MAGLEIRDLTVRYGERVALDGVDLDVADAEVVAVLGPSGSGKSTLLRAVAGLVPTTHGTIRHGGSDLSGTPPHARGFGLMFQDHALFPHLDVLGNVGFGLRMRGEPARAVAERAREVLATVGLEGAADRRVQDLSGGEQQRVALARALAPEPSLLMLDEPLGSLDRVLRDELAGELATLFSRIGISALVVTHDQDEAFALADRIAVLDRGRIVQVGTPAQVWERPATRFVAEFLGWTVTDGLDGAPTGLRPDAVRLVPLDTPAASAGDARGGTGVVVRRTRGRSHWRLRLRVEAPVPWEVDLEHRQADAPPLGATVAFVIDGSATIRL